MDPNETLKQIRQLVAELRRETPHREECSELAERVEALDEWLSRGGFLPEAWRK